MKDFGRGAAALLPPLLLLAAHVARADDGYDAERRELEHVQVTATRRAADDFDVSAAISQVDRVSVREEAPDVLAEILRGLPGAFFQQTTPGQGVPIIRGLKGSQVLHLVDGMRLNNAFFRDAPNQYLALVDAYAIERVEVLRGAAGSLYGADAMGGVVNILTPEPVYSGRDWQQESELYGAFNSADDGWVTRAATRGGRDGFAFAGGVSWQDHGDRRSGGGQDIVPSAYRARAADLKLVMSLGERSELMLGAQALEQPQTPRVDELVPGYGQELPSSEVYWFRPNRRDFLHARYRGESELDWLDRVELHLARQLITDDRESRDLGAPDLSFEANESRLDGFTAQFDATLPGGTPLSWGVEVYRDAISSTRRVLDLDSQQESGARGRFPDGSTMDSLAAWVHAEWALAERLSLTTGLRYSAFDIRLPGTDDLDPVKLTPADVTGDLSLLYAVRDDLHLVANVGRGFRPPNIFDLATLGPRPGNRFNVPNPELGPEFVWSYDAGIKFRSGDLQYELFAFRLDYQDRITSVSTGETTPGGRAIVRGENRNALRVHGFEAGLRWTLSDAVEVFGTLNYTRGAERSDDGATTPGDRIPPLNGQWGLTWQPGDDWELKAWWLFAARQDRLSSRDADDPRMHPNGTPGWGTLNLLASRRVGAHWQFGLKLENPGDLGYREHGSGIDAPGRNVGVFVNANW